MKFSPYPIYLLNCTVESNYWGTVKTFPSQFVLLVKIKYMMYLICHIKVYLLGLNFNIHIFWVYSEGSGFLCVQIFLQQWLHLSRVGLPSHRTGKTGFQVKLRFILAHWQCLVQGSSYFERGSCKDIFFTY